MQFSEHWLRQYANPPIGVRELADRLTMAGLEVESVDPVAPPFSDVVVARVSDVQPHPDADKLTVCRVDAGGKLLTIVCGAPNVVAGIKVPCALAGATLPSGLSIRETAVRGVMSEGMLCSARELGLSDDHAGLLQLPPDAPIGADVRGVLALDDQRLTIKLTPNRADCLSVVGVAREVAATTGAQLALPKFDRVEPQIDDKLPVRVEASDLCGRFSGRVIRGVNASAQTPSWMRQRLERSGQRSISALVDISNYVMLELGRPSHVFDLDKVVGGLTVRWGRPGEKLMLLSGQTVEIDADVGVIADERGVEALAGVMGGEETAVNTQTRNIYLEAAFWWPDAIRGRARRYNFSTDAAHRFERGVDFASTVEHIEYLTRLIVDICGGRPGPVDDTVVSLPTRTPVGMRIARCQRVLGMPVAAQAMADAFTRLGLAYVQTGDAFVVTPPSWRFDLEIEEDLIEEVARMVGYAQLPADPPRVPAVMRSPSESRRTAHEIRRELATLGYQETISYSFVSEAMESEFAPDEPRILVVNPISSEMSVMRSTLAGSLVAALAYNLNRKVPRARLFEIARVFRRDPAVVDGPLSVAGIEQPNRVGAIAYGSNDDDQWGIAGRDVDFFDVKGDLERLLRQLGGTFVAAQHPALHPGRSAAVTVDGRPIGWIGVLHPRLQHRYELPKAPVLFEVDLEPLLDRPMPSYVEVSRFHPVLRDVSLTVEEAVPVADLQAEVSRLAVSDRRLSALREFRLFDLYRPRPDSSKFTGAGANALLNKEKNLAFRIVLQDTERALNDADAEAAVAAIVEGLEKRCGARLRQ